MSELFPVHTLDTAPLAGREILAQINQKYGFVPNLMGVMANAPPLLKGYVTLSKLLTETSLSPLEQQILLLIVSAENHCHYCVAVHSAGAKRAGATAEIVESVRTERPLKDAKLEVLRRFAITVVKTRGFPEARDIEVFLSAGYGHNQILEVILAIGLKTLSNYTNHIAHTPLDAAFASERLDKTA